MGRGRSGHDLCAAPCANAGRRKPEPSTRPAPAAPAPARMKLRRLSHFNGGFRQETKPSFRMLISFLTRILDVQYHKIELRANAFFDSPFFECENRKPGRQSAAYQLEHHAAVGSAAQLSGAVQVARRIPHQTGDGIRSVRSPSEAAEYCLSASRA